MVDNPTIMSIPSLIFDANTDALRIATKKPVYSKDGFDDEKISIPVDKDAVARTRIVTKDSYIDEDRNLITDPLDIESVSPSRKYDNDRTADPLTVYHDNEAVQAKHDNEPYEAVRADIIPKYKVF